MTNETETPRPHPERPPAAYRRDLHRARLVIGQLRDAALASGEPFQAADLALDAAALDELWDGLDRIDSRFWKDEEYRRYMDARAEIPTTDTKRPWWKFWEAG